METNFLIIMVVTIIGMSIPIVICCVFFSICDPKILRNHKVIRILYYINGSVTTTIVSIKYKIRNTNTK